MLNIEGILDSLYPDENDLLVFLEEHKFSGVYYKLNQDSHNVLKKSYLKQLHRNTLYLEELDELATHFHESEKKKIVLLKGAALLNRLYDDIGTRWMSDIDVLLPKNSVENFIQILFKLNFKEIEESKWEGNNFKGVYHKVKEGVEIVLEVHTRLFFHQEVDDYKLIKSAEHPFMNLSPEEEYLHLIGHCIFQHNFLKFYWLYDCLKYKEMYSDKFDLSELKALAKKRKLFRSLQIFYFVCDNFFHLPLDAKTKEVLELNSSSLWQSLLNGSLIYSGRQSGVRYFLFKFFTKDSFSTTISYTFFWLKNFLKKRLST